MKFNLDNLLPPGRESINLPDLIERRVINKVGGINECVCVSIKEPCEANHKSLVAGMQKILPVIYQSPEQACQLLMNYGMRMLEKIPFPDSTNFQKAHAGEILTCAYFEECENAVVLSYKWRLNTTKNQHQYGMDLLAFDFGTNPPTIYAIAVKTTYQGGTGQRPTVIGNAIDELTEYIAGEKLDDDLGVIARNLHTDERCETAFKSWYSPYRQGIHQSIPKLILVPAIVVDEDNWRDEYAAPAILNDFGLPGAVRILCVKSLEEFVRQVYSRGKS
jgi:hypothetical protein